jgi:hypothetical protein
MCAKIDRRWGSDKGKAAGLHGNPVNKGEEAVKGGLALRGTGLTIT